MRWFITSTFQSAGSEIIRQRHVVLFAPIIFGRRQYGSEGVVINWCYLGKKCANHLKLAHIVAFRTTFCANYFGINESVVYISYFTLYYYFSLSVCLFVCFFDSPFISKQLQYILFFFQNGNKFKLLSVYKLMMLQFQRWYLFPNHWNYKYWLFFIVLHYSAERQKYYKHIYKAKKYPNKYLSLIIDGMDQKTTSLPKPRLLSKHASAMWKLSCHVVAVIVHGRGHHVYVDVGEIPQDSNCTCNILMQTFLKHVDHLSPILYVQMDNTVRENKNQFVFPLFCVLVELKFLLRYMCY